MSFIKAADLGKKVLDDYNAAMDEPDRIKQGSTVIDVVARHEKEIQELKQWVTMQKMPTAKERLIRIMGTFDLATGHAETFNELLDSLESELRDVLGHYREQRKWVGLTDEEIHNLGWMDEMSFEDEVELVREVEAKFKEKNGG